MNLKINNIILLLYICTILKIIESNVCISQFLPTSNEEESSPRRKLNEDLECLRDFNHTFEALKIDEDKQLQTVHLLFRHGARTPTVTYPNDPYINNTFAPYGWGQLTNEGKCHLYDTGKWLRTRYNKFLGDKYYPNLVYARTTRFDRTYMSMATILASLFKPKGTPMEWNKNLNWQPIPIFSEEIIDDTLLLEAAYCPRVYQALNEILERPKVKKYLEDNHELYEELTKLTGLKIKTPADIFMLYSALSAEEEFGLVLPDWIQKYYPDKIKDNKAFSFILNVYTDELKRIKSGPFLKKMSNEWIAKSQNKLVPKERKIYLYSGHDVTVVNILAALNVWTKQIPGYGIMAIFELYKNIKTEEYEVKIYQKNEGQDPIPLKLPGCVLNCPLEKVLKLIEPMVAIENMKRECTLNGPNATIPKPFGPWIIIYK